MAKIKDVAKINAGMQERQSACKECLPSKYDDASRKLQKVINELSDRCVPTYDLKQAYVWLTISSTNLANNTNINRYRDDLVAIIDKIVDLAGKSQPDAVIEAIDPFVHFHPKLGQLYELQAIFLKLKSDPQALITLSLWAKGYPRKWVQFDPKMSLEEKQMLAMVACYLEAKERRLESVTSNAKADSDNEVIESPAPGLISDTKLTWAESYVEKSKKE